MCMAGEFHPRQVSLSGMLAFVLVVLTHKLPASKIKSEDHADHVFDYQGIIHNAFVPSDTTVNSVFYKEVMERLLKRIQRVRSNFLERGNWVLLDDNASKHKWLITK